MSDRISVIDPKASVAVRNDTVSIASVGIQGPTGPPTLSIDGAFVTSTGGRVRHKAGDAGASWDIPERFNVRDYGADTSISDNRAFIQNAINAAEAAGGGTVVFPEVYPIASVGGTIGFGSGKDYVFDIMGDDITLEGPGGIDCRGLYAILGDEYHGFAVGTAKGIEDMLAQEAVHTLTGVYAKGDRTITLATVGDGANYVAGDYIYIRTGQTIDNSFTTQPDCEINRVRSIASGVIELEWPLSKPYQQEYFVTGTVGLTNTTVTANLAAFGIVNMSSPTNWVIHRPTFRNLQMYADTSYAFITMFHPIKAIIEDCTAFLNASMVQGLGRGARIRRNRVDATPIGGLEPVRDCQTHWVAGDTKTVDAIIENNDFTSGGNGWLHIHEGCAQVSILNNRLTTLISAEQFGAATGYSCINVESRGYDIDIQGNIIRGGGAGATGIRVAGQCNGGGKIGRNDIDNMPSTSAISVGSDNWHISADNQVHGKIVRRSLDFAQTGRYENIGLMPCEAVTLPGRWLTPGVQTVTLGVIPTESLVIGVTVDVTTAFNSDGTDQIKVGYDGTATTERAFADLTDVSSASPSRKSPAVGSVSYYQTTAITAKAYYVNGGSEPTTGRALVTLTYIPAPLRPSGTG